MKQLTSLILYVVLSSCMTLPDGSQAFDSAKATRIASAVVLSALTSYAQTQANGGQIDKAWAVGQGMFALSEVIKGLDNQQAASMIQGATIQYAADPRFATIGTKLANTYVAMNPVTPEQKQAAVVALGVGAQQGTQKAVEALP